MGDTEGLQEVVIGIDLGTTYSCVGVWDWEAGQVEIVVNEQGTHTTPSVVSFHKNDVLVGSAAKAKANVNPEGTIYNAKRILGRPYDHVRKEDLERWPFRVVRSPDGKPRYQVPESRRVSPEEISGMVLAKMKALAEKRTGREVKKAVVTVPAYFTEPQKRATRDAAQLAGLEILRLLPEPTAAALAFGLDRKALETRQEKMLIDGSYILVFDMGGGTFDVSVLKLDGRGSFITKAVTGDFHLGGEDFDDRILDWVLRSVSNRPDIDHERLKMPKVRQRIRRQCEQAKRELSTMVETSIQFDIGEIEVEVDITRAQFEQLCQDLFENAMREVSEALELAEISKDEVDDVVLVGGSTRIPRLQQALQDFFQGRKLWCGANPDEAVAWGATALAAALVQGQRLTSGACAPIHSPNALPHGTVAVPLHNVVLTSVTPITLGIELSDKSLDVLIPRASKIPTSKSDTYTTANDGQRSVVIKVYEGEVTSAACKNYLLGKFSLSVDDAPKGVPQIKVTFQITVDGLFLVTARNIQNSTETTVKIENANLSVEEREKLGINDQDCVAAPSTARAEFRALVSRVYGEAASDPKILELCTGALEWMEANPTAPPDAVEKRRREFDAVLATL